MIDNLGITEIGPNVQPIDLIPVFGDLSNFYFAVENYPDQGSSGLVYATRWDDTTFIEVTKEGESKNGQNGINGLSTTVPDDLYLFFSLNNGLGNQVAEIKAQSAFFVADMNMFYRAVGFTAAQLPAGQNIELSVSAHFLLDQISLPATQSDVAWSTLYSGNTTQAAEPSVIWKQNVTTSQTTSILEYGAGINGNRTLIPFFYRQVDPADKVYGIFFRIHRTPALDFGASSAARILEYTNSKVNISSPILWKQYAKNDYSVQLNSSEVVFSKYEDAFRP